MSKHTPGPWRAERTETVRGNPAWLIDSETIRGLALLEFMSAEDRDGFGAANAALMAAAPDLLAALEGAQARLAEVERVMREYRDGYLSHAKVVARMLRLFPPSDSASNAEE